jgi:hypothetical protein
LNGIVHAAVPLLHRPGDASLCHRVGAALNQSWQLYGPPTLAFHAGTGRMICGQALIMQVEGDCAAQRELTAL